LNINSIDRAIKTRRNR